MRVGGMVLAGSASTARRPSAPRRAAARGGRCRPSAPCPRRGSAACRCIAGRASRTWEVFRRGDGRRCRDDAPAAMCQCSKSGYGACSAFAARRRLQQQAACPRDRVHACSCAVHRVVLRPQRPCLPMAAILHDVVFLVDVDNTLLDNDRIIADLRDHLTQEFGVGLLRPLLDAVREAARRARLRRLPRRAAALSQGRGRQGRARAGLAADVELPRRLPVPGSRLSRARSTRSRA